jgi:outer membrane immunogenic protein
MKKYMLSVSIIAATLAAGSAFAADLPSRKAPLIAPPPPPPMWTGFYAGLNAGWSWSNSNQVYTQTFSGVNDAEGASGASALSATGVASAPMDGFIGGGQIGYNHQFANNFVLGVEADIQGSTITGGGTFTGVGQIPGKTDITIGQDHRSVEWLGTVRGRVGYLVTPNLLVYGTGGLAYGGVTADTSIFNVWTNGQAGGGASHYSDTLVGWTAGGGVEWMFAPNWSTKVEYLYYDLGNAQWDTAWGIAGKATALPNFTTTHTHFDGHIVRAGVSYHFNWFTPPVVAGY